MTVLNCSTLSFRIEGILRTFHWTHQMITAQLFHSIVADRGYPQDVPLDSSNDTAQWFYSIVSDRGCESEHSFGSFMTDHHEQSNSTSGVAQRKRGATQNTLNSLCAYHRLSHLSSGVSHRRERHRLDHLELILCTSPTVPPLQWGFSPEREAPFEHRELILRRSHRMALN